MAPGAGEQVLARTSGSGYPWPLCSLAASASGSALCAGDTGCCARLAPSTNPNSTSGVARRLATFPGRHKPTAGQRLIQSMRQGSAACATGLCAAFASAPHIRRVRGIAARLPGSGGAVADLRGRRPSGLRWLRRSPAARLVWSAVSIPGNAESHHRRPSCRPLLWNGRCGALCAPQNAS